MAPTTDREQLTFEGLEVDVETFKVKAFPASSVISQLELGTTVRVVVECECVDVRHPRDPKTGIVERLHILKPVDMGQVIEEVSRRGETSRA